ncbi:heavy metal translocating P-type ATPase [Nocardioides sp.]|uniref:heavy metal translocating P-type ATPase n=1 Tax=Nocardioides sp. TaxID=35761 RepID=UPI003516DA93
MDEQPVSPAQVPQGPEAPRLVALAASAGRVRISVPALRGSRGRAVHAEEMLDAVEGVRAVHAYWRTGQVVVWFRPGACDVDRLVAMLGGLSAVPALPAERLPRSDEVSNGDIVRIALGGAALLLLGGRRYVLRRPPVLGPTSRTLATGVTIATGYPFLRGALRGLAGGRGLGTDALVSAATVASLALRENVVALTVLWLLNIGEYLQDLTLRRTRRAIRDLLTGAQDDAWVRRTALDGTTVEQRVPIEDLRVGDLVVVHDHVALPVDGEVVEGEAVADTSAITGETLPVRVETGRMLHAGTVVMKGRIVVRASAVGRDTAIGRIITRVEEAQHDRAAIQTVGENFSRRFVPASLLLAAGTFVVTRDVRRAMTMLLIACPCAVGLSTPTAISAAIGNGARRGILVKGGSHLELAGRVDAVVFDKTGTLTIGRPVVTNVVSFRSDFEAEQVLAYAASSEIHSRHPLAEAVIRSTEERHIAIPEHEECEVLLGLGMRTIADGRTMLLGSTALLEREGVGVTADALAWVDRLRAAAETPLLLAIDGRLTGLVSLRDTVRPEARDVIEALRADGVRRIVMLTGDHPQVAAAVAAELGIDEWRAEVMPEHKQDVVRSLQQEGHTVAMVGDGTNDAPALALADVGIAMGIGGTDVALEAAEIALAGDDLTRLLDLRELARHTVRTIRQNYGMSIAVNAVGLAVGAGGALSPVAAALLHNASSIAVVANSARTTRHQLPSSAPASAPRAAAVPSVSVSEPAPGAVLGVDGCRSGWVGAVWTPGAPAVQVVRADDIDTLVRLARAQHDVRLVGIDIPIGLPDDSIRQADVLARRALPGKASSIFTTLTRAAYAETDRASADAVNRRLTGQGVGAQAFAIAAKIREVDTWLREGGASEAGIEMIEVHPEVTFAAISGAPIRAPKRTPEGRALRIAALAAVGIEVPDPLVPAGERGVAPDDVVDACAVAWTAARRAAGEAECLPSPPERFSDGLPAAIHR